MFDLMMEVLLELNQWVHPVSGAFVTDDWFFRVVPSLDEALVRSTDESSPELNFWKEISILEFTLNLLIWDLSLNWKEIVWSFPGWLLMIMVFFILRSPSMIMLIFLLVIILMMLMVVLMSLDHLEEMWMS